MLRTERKNEWVQNKPVFARLQNKPVVQGICIIGKETPMTTIAGTIKLIHNNQPMHINMQRTVLTWMHLGRVM